jgi:molybdenum cofactor cytidylyltransferase
MRFPSHDRYSGCGAGSRFGGPLHKLQQEFDGGTVLGATVRQAIETQCPWSW